MTCSVCGAEAVVLRGTIYSPTHYECLYCGARDCAKQGPPRPACLDGGAMLSPAELEAYAGQYGDDALDDLMARGPGG